ncbi:MAG: hypothetical protein MJ214_04060 [Bacilli bacterium]|nr:hypothetical protein [Bacilli bacterium]
MKNLNKGEIIRFIVTGVLSAIVDFIFSFLASFISQKAGIPGNSVWCTVIGTIIGFLASIGVGYPLSVKWVYQDADKNKISKHKKTHLLFFTLLSAAGLMIGIGIMSIFKVSLNSGLGINIDTWMNVSIPTDYNFWQKIGAWISGVLTNIAFWYFALAFVVKSLFVLTFNYYTRKKFLFR